MACCDVTRVLRDVEVLSQVLCDATGALCPRGRTRKRRGRGAAGRCRDPRGGWDGDPHGRGRAQHVDTELRAQSLQSSESRRLPGLSHLGVSQPHCNTPRPGLGTAHRVAPKLRVVRTQRPDPLTLCLPLCPVAPVNSILHILPRRHATRLCNAQAVPVRGLDLQLCNAGYRPRAPRLTPRLREGSRPCPQPTLAVPSLTCRPGR